MQQKNLPIGYYIKQVDELLTEGINKVMAAFNLTRVKWQVLNSIQENAGITKKELVKLMKPFATAVVIENILEGYRQQGHITAEDTDKILLTSKGLQLHAACLEQQLEFRKKIMTGISESDYQSTILTLQKIVRNSYTLF